MQGFSEEGLNSIEERLFIVNETKCYLAQQTPKNVKKRPN